MHSTAETYGGRKLQKLTTHETASNQETLAGGAKLTNPARSMERLCACESEKIEDLNMPRMNGLEFLSIIKEHERFKLIPIVVLTTSADERDRINSFKLNVAGYMIKPIDYNQFINMMTSIKNYWENSQLAY